MSLNPVPTSDVEDQVKKRSFLSSGAAVMAVATTGQVIVLGAQWTAIRVLGTEQFGVLTYVRSWIGLLLIVALAGIDTAMIRFLPDLSSRVPQQARGLIRFATRRTLLFSVAVGAVGAFGLFVFGASNRSQYEFFVGVLLLVTWAQHQVRHSALSGFEMVLRATVLTAIARPIIWLALILFANLYFTVDGAGSLALLALAFAVTSALGDLSVRRRTLGVDVSAPPAERELWWRTAVPLGLVSSMRTLMTRTDILVVGVIHGTTEAAIYAVASRLALLAALGQGVATSVVSPRLAGLHAKGNRTEMEGLGALAARFASTSILLAFVTSFFFAEPALELFGKEFGAGRTVFLILTIGQLLNSMCGPVGAALNMTGNEAVNARILAVSVTLNLVLSIPATHWFGITGAATATAFIVTFKNATTWYVVRKRLGINLSVIPSRKVTS